jgi:hypothetical protein
MSIFGYRSANSNRPPRSALAVLRSTLKNLEAESERTEQIADLKRILTGRIAEMERKGLEGNAK